MAQSGCADRWNRVFGQLHCPVTSGETLKLKRAAGNTDLALTDLFLAREKVLFAIESRPLCLPFPGGTE